MIPAVTVGKADDPEFIELLNAVVRGLVASHAPEQLWIVQIDNWFDHRWLRFSGIGNVDFPWTGLPVGLHGALDGLHQEKLTFPPFSPNRVLGQWSYVRTSDGYAETALPHLPHPTERQRSKKNLHRRVQAFSRSACFIWYSSNTVANDRASVMVYAVAAERVESWFAAFRRKGMWKLQAAKGVSRDDVQRLLNPM